MPPLVSICLPNLNNRRFLEPRMDSILSQTLADWELIVCDSQSDDGAWAFFQRFASDTRIRLHSVPRAGLYAGWNECLRRATGQYVYMATSDDTMSPACLEKLAGALENAESGKQKAEIDTKDQRPPASNLQLPPSSPISTFRFPFSAFSSPAPSSPSQPSTFNLQPATHNPPISTFPSPPLPPDIAVCNFDYIDEHGTRIDPPLPPAGAFYGEDRFRAHRRSGYLEFLAHLLIGTSWTTMTAVMFRRSLLEKTGLFREDVPGALADRLWAYRSALHSDTVVVPETLATWRQHPAQGSAAGQGRRDVQTLKHARALWRASVETVRDCRPLFPEAWRRQPDFLKTVLWAERRHYFDRYCLSRTHLRHHPRAFLRGLAQAAVLEPRYMLARLACGLAWPADHDLSETEYLRHLLHPLAAPPRRCGVR